MSTFSYPVKLSLDVAANVTCRVNDVGGTTVSAAYIGYADVVFKDVTFEDYNVELQGYDGLAGRIEVALREQIAQALKDAS